jgi:hypothetical protein
MTEKNNIENLWEQFSTISHTLDHINKGNAVAAIHVPGEGFVELDNIFDNPNYIEKMQADLASYKIDLAQQLINELQGIIDADAAAVTQENIEPFPIGTPKADHRRTTIDMDESK